MQKLILALCLAYFSTNAAAIPNGPPVFLLPMACSELLPDTDPFIRFLDSVARGNLTSEQSLSKRIFRLMALRDKVTEKSRVGKSRNPVDIMVQKTLCFYRQQKEPLKPVPYDDEAFLKFLKAGMDDMEQQINAAIRQDEIEKFQKKEFERKLEQNRDREEALRRQALKDAEKELKQISEAAKRQAKAGS